MTVGMLPAAAGATEVSAAAGQTRHASSTTAATWSLVGTVDPQHVSLGNAQMIVYGAFLFTPNQVRFDPKAIPLSTMQVVVPYAMQPGPGTYTYKLVFHLLASTTATRFRLDNRTPVELAAGATTLEFVTDTFQTNQPSWPHWGLANANGDAWAFSSCDIYQQTS
jgi:hypothetical protein